MAKLQLALKAEYFDAIKSGEKTEEFRLATEYWTKRLRVPIDTYETIILTKGYPKRGDPERTLELPWRGYTRKTIIHPHFGPEPVEVFAIIVAAPPSTPGYSTDTGKEG
jgi:hypothetical protein